MAKKLCIGLLTLASIIGIGFAIDANYCATAKCFNKGCGAVYHDTIGAPNRKDAIKQAKSMLEHKAGCARINSKIKGTAALGACPPAPANESDGE